MNALRELLERDVHIGAKALLGAYIIRGDRVARIVEVEAYRTPDDPGCHAHRGQTVRNRAMYEDPGTAYVYFSYGVHWMLNVVAHGCGNAAAVLIRAAEPLAGIDKMVELRRATQIQSLLSGPGKLAQAFSVGPNDYGVDLLGMGDLRIEIGEPPKAVIATTRIGLAKGKGELLEWRYLDTEATRWISQPIQVAKPSKKSVISPSIT